MKAENTKAVKIIWWISTGIIAVMMLLSAYSYVAREEVKQACQHLGFPGYFRIELAAAKFLGVLALVLPITERIKEWAYFGFALVFISAFIAHVASGDLLSHSIGSLGCLLVLAVSYVTFHKSRMTLHK